MNLQSINSCLKKIGINITISKFSKIISFNRSKEYCRCYIKIDNQNELVNEFFRMKYPHIINYNNYLYLSKNGEVIGIGYV